MTEETAVVIQPDVEAVEWRTREEIVAMGRRIKSMLPGGKNLSEQQAMSLAQYSLAMGANPYRGEVYGFTGKGGFQLVEGYKLLVRWARRQCEYTERFIPAPGIPEGAIGVRCFILREDKKPTMREFISMGASFKEAYEMASVYADGIVQASEMGKDPPAGWTWEQVARKRALKNALNLSHGAPSLKEIAAATWDVNGHETAPEDWQTITPQMSPVEREATAEFNAAAREAHEHAGDVTATEAIDDLFGEYESADDTPVTVEIATEEEAEPPTEAAPAPWTNDADVMKRLWVWLRKQTINGAPLTDEQIHEAAGVESLKLFTGTVGDLKNKVLAYIKAETAEAVTE